MVPLGLLLGRELLETDRMLKCSMRETGHLSTLIAKELSRG